MYFPSPMRMSLPGTEPYSWPALLGSAVCGRPEVISALALMALAGPEPKKLERPGCRRMRRPDLSHAVLVLMISFTRVTVFA
jgi:hypothetical protein